MPADWPTCWIGTPDRSSSSVARSVQDAWDIYGDELGLVPPDVVLALGDAASGSCVDDFLDHLEQECGGWTFWGVLSGWWSH